MDYSFSMGYEHNPARESLPSAASEALVSAWYRMQVQNAHLLQRLAVEHELNPIDLRALKFLGVDESPRTPKELATFLQVGSSLVSAVIERLESRQFIHRAPNPQDRRSTLLHLELRGVQVVEQLRSLYGRALSGLFGHPDQDAIVTATNQIEEGLRDAASF
ncbi:transcriptional regulator [Microbacterium testaceum StLB037]|uniref:Transcriptional regulator n=2 Tax=Microbacterium testaceum TaxID=2033 RepID=E8N8X8_MICTS|nr:transcriptional regulator [Microbacterium testaceum StLB037]